jgi:hypothetical protein
MRLTGVVIGTAVARAVLMAHIRQANAPDLATYKFSDNWVRIFLHDQLNWSMRKTTRATAKIPDDWVIQCRRTHGSILYLLKMHSIDEPDLLANYDHSGQSLAPMGNMTWEEKGKKQVRGATHEEKRQVVINFVPILYISDDSSTQQTTLVIGSTAGGSMLPLQTIWGGKTAASLPSRTALRRDEADKHGFSYGHGDTRHWSSLETTKEVSTSIMTARNAIG